MLKTIQEDKTIEWVVYLFHPIFEAVNVCSLNSGEERCISLSDYPLYIRYGLERCVLFVRYAPLPKEQHGLCITSYRKQEDIFLFQIVLNQELSNKNLYIKRKYTFIHESLHVIAVLLSLRQIRSAELKRQLNEKLKNKVTLLTEDTLTKLIDGITQWNLGHNDQILQDFDTHYRLGWEDFPASYFSLFEELMLSKKEFETIFTKEQQETFKIHIQLGNNAALLQLLKNVFQEISNTYYVDLIFVAERFFNAFIKSYLKK